MPSSSSPSFLPWQPSTRPNAPEHIDEEFIANLRDIFASSMLSEIDNVVRDIQQANGDLRHRGHVVGIALMSALYAISHYGYHGTGKKKQIPNFVQAHFPPEYRPYGGELLVLYRLTSRITGTSSEQDCSQVMKLQKSKMACFILAC